MSPFSMAATVLTLLACELFKLLLVTDKIINKYTYTLSVHVALNASQTFIHLVTLLWV